MPRKPRFSPADPQAAPAAAPGLALSPTAQALFDDVRKKWDLTAPVAALLRLAAEAQTKAEQLEQITAVEGMTIPDSKGACKPHPAALLARDYRAQASGALQRLLAHLEK